MTLPRKILIGALGVLGALVVAGVVHEVQLRWPRPIQAPRLGTLRAMPAWLWQSGFVYVFSGDEGWNAADETVARAYARGGNFVAGIDTPQLLRYLNHEAPGCVFLPGMLEDFSHAQQRAALTTRFAPPVLLGRGTGATLAYLAQLQAPPLAFRAAVALDPSPRLALVPPLCEHAAAARDASTQTVKPERPGNNAPMRLALDSQAPPDVRAFAAAIGGPIAVSGTARDVYAAALRDIEADSQRNGLGDLPLVEVPAATPRGRAFAVLYSGDGGWRDLDRTLASVLAAKGVNVVGVDVLRYYWSTKTPERAATDLARIIRYYRTRWQVHEVLLIGFSFGADVLPFLVNRLPADVSADVGLLSLLSPERSTGFAVEAGGWLGLSSAKAVPIEPELAGLSKLRVQCIYGAEEGKNSLCTTRAGESVQSVRKSGGHHFDRNYDELADEILAAGR